MYILKNSLISIFRNKGRIILIGLIILTIACASTVTLAIRNTADTIVKSYEESHDLIATISFNRGQLGKNFKGGEDAQKENIEAFTAEVKEKGLNEYYTVNTNLEEITSATESIENVKTFATTFIDCFNNFINNRSNNWNIFSQTSRKYVISKWNWIKSKYTRRNVK